MLTPQVAIEGNLTREPVLRWSENGKAVASFGIAYTERKKSYDGQWENGETWFVTVSAFGFLAENIGNAGLTKGRRVIVVGRMGPNVYQAKDGTERREVKIIADTVGTSLGQRADGRKSGAPAPAAAKDESW